MAGGESGHSRLGRTREGDDRVDLGEMEVSVATGEGGGDEGAKGAVDCAEGLVEKGQGRKEVVRGTIDWGGRR